VACFLPLFGLLLLAVPTTIAVVQFVAGRRRADQTAVLWTLATAARANLPLAEELDALVDTLSRGQARKTRRLAERLRTGESLSVALDPPSGVIPSAAVLAVRVGEENGLLATALGEAAVTHSRLRSDGGHRLPLMSVAIPAAVFLAAVSIVGFLLYFVVPKFKKIFSDFGVGLPEVTNEFISVADVVVTYWHLVSLVSWVPPAVLVWAIVRHCRGWGEGDVPLLGRWFRRFDVPGILRQLAVPAAAGRPLLDTLHVLAAGHPRRAVRKDLSRAAEQCSDGDDCWYALRDVGLLRDPEAAALRAARRVGNVPWALERLAEAIESRLAHRGRTAFELVRPLGVLAVGLLVAVVEIALFSPLVELIANLD
jgi:type IV pilus assembly protein PilC